MQNSLTILICYVASSGTEAWDGSLLSLLQTRGWSCFCRSPAVSWKGWFLWVIVVSKFLIISLVGKGTSFNWEWLLWFFKVWGKTASKIYGPMAGEDYKDNQLRFSLLCQVESPSSSLCACIVYWNFFFELDLKLNMHGWPQKSVRYALMTSLYGHMHHAFVTDYLIFFHKRLHYTYYVGFWF